MEDRFKFEELKNSLDNAVKENKRNNRINKYLSLTCTKKATKKEIESIRIYYERWRDRVIKNKMITDTDKN